MRKSFPLMIATCGLLCLQAAVADDMVSPVRAPGNPTLNCFPPAELTGPKAIGSQLVEYPAASTVAHEGGHALISYTVRNDGTVEEVRLEQSSGYSRLDRAAVAAAATWHFDASGMNAQFLPTRRTQYVDFALASGRASAGNLCLPPPPMSARAVPMPLGQHSLIYPLEAISAAEEGTVFVSFKILTDGSVVDPAVVQGSGHARLDQAALDSVRTWRYQPIAEPFVMTQTLTFSLKNIRRTP